ncbi:MULTISPECIES: glycosyltransferase family 2 protein [Afifella]|uniref:glycosyltransferase family 2 protein n=1 Tax=Afifella TaxID=643217 RepID=UPI000FE2D002|nr:MULTISPECIES: glycosyltransferase [Afifella]MCT8266259.1 glycosyltransferase [Afifella sp. JA880]
MSDFVLADVLLQATRVIAWFVIASGLAQSAVYLFQLVVAGATFYQRPPVARSSLLWHRYSDVAPPIALIVPAYNEQLNIVSTVYSLLSIEYPSYEVIVVNDGSKDETLSRLRETFDMREFERPHDDALPHAPIRNIYSSRNSDRLFVIDKENGGKADAQNAGINLCRAPLFCVVDGDSIVEPDALMRVAQPFIDDPNRTIGVGGTIRIANNSLVDAGRITDVRLPKRLLPLFQVVEYIRAFLMARVAWSRINTLMLVSGAFGVFRRREVIDVGGYTPGSMGEDLDLVIKLHRSMIEKKRKYRITFVPEPVCWTEAPETLSVLGRQRARWQRGALECFFRYRHMAFNPRYGRIGFLGFGQMFIVDVLGPVVEVLGYILMPTFYFLGGLSLEYLLAYTALVFVFGVFISVGSLVLEEIELKRFPTPRSLFILAMAAIIENFGYRQINNYWRLKGLWQYLRSDNSWGEMTRIGFQSRSP